MSETPSPDDFMQHTIDEFRANDGKVGGWFEGAPLLILHTVGAKSGAERVAPLMYLDVDGEMAVFASKGGADENPSWFYNLKANPLAQIEVGTDTVAVKARETEGDERASIWGKQVSAYPTFGDYERKTARAFIPVIVLERV